MCKTGNRAKDIYDCNIFEKAVDKNKLRRLKEAFKYNLPNMIVEAKKDDFSEFRSYSKILKSFR